MKPLMPALLLAAAVLAPGLALADGCRSDEKAAMSCAEGSVWNGETGRCTPKPSA
jgi:hypothetical protein